MEFLTIEEVAKILKMHTNTVYKMCREGKLPSVKIGKEWRIERSRFAKFLESGTRNTGSDTGREVLQDILKGGHVLGVFIEKEDIAAFETSFFAALLNKNYCLFKACWWQHPDDVRFSLSRGGLPVEELEASGSLVIVDLNKVFCTSSPVSAAEEWLNAAKKALAQGYKGLIGSGSPHFECCGSHPALMEFEDALDKGLKGLPVTGVCSYHMDCSVSDSFTRLADLIAHHDRLFIRTPAMWVTAQGVETAFQSKGGNS
ncbi:MAG: MEDS domain-containing protein [Thermodesulfovibrionales bacterium]